jgi:hypothetical protein
LWKSRRAGVEDLPFPERLHPSEEEQRDRWIRLEHIRAQEEVKGCTFKVCMCIDIKIQTYRHIVIGMICLCVCVYYAYIDELGIDITWMHLSSDIVRRWILII